MLSYSWILKCFDPFSVSQKVRLQSSRGLSHKRTGPTGGEIIQLSVIKFQLAKMKVSLDVAKCNVGLLDSSFPYGVAHMLAGALCIAIHVLIIMDHAQSASRFA